MLTDNGLIWANRMEMSWVYGGGIEFWFGAGFLVVPKCCTIVDRFQGLQLVRQLCSIWLFRSLQQK